MSCWCGHGPWHYYQGYPYPPPAGYAPPPAGYAPPPAGYAPPPAEHYPPAGPVRRRRRRRADAQELADYLEDLEAEITRIRGELDELRRSETADE
ncbi:hypothetical protein [Mycolicibacterium pyrenivorans]|uniref:hypothetical protein n=1 Tax=Mycolicibacterium pyrenivorans TaxID=187102 RepID=UPI0021F34061|nr:hypothetical protein [Mycolicibacterium pyrenivorans]